jgi:hypothetical protein
VSGLPSPIVPEHLHHTVAHSASVVLVPAGGIAQIAIPSAAAEEQRCPRGELDTERVAPVGIARNAPPAEVGELGACPGELDNWSPARPGVDGAAKDSFPAVIAGENVHVHLVAAAAAGRHDELRAAAVAVCQGTVQADADVHALHTADGTLWSGHSAAEAAAAAVKPGHLDAVAEPLDRNEIGDMARVAKVALVDVTQSHCAAAAHDAVPYTHPAVGIDTDVDPPLQRVVALGSPCAHHDGLEVARCVQSAVGAAETHETVPDEAVLDTVARAEVARAQRDAERRLAVAPTDDGIDDAVLSFLSVVQPAHFVAEDRVHPDHYAKAVPRDHRARVDYLAHTIDVAAGVVAQHARQAVDCPHEPRDVDTRRARSVVLDAASHNHLVEADAGPRAPLVEHGGCLHHRGTGHVGGQGQPGSHAAADRDSLGAGAEDASAVK